jgi:hypothetical protein
MVVENNSSLAHTMNEQHRALAMRSNMLSEMQNYMGGMGLIPDALGTMSPTAGQMHGLQEAAQDELHDKTYQPDDIADETNQSPRSPRHVEPNESMQSVQSSKKLYMDEITALIKKATSQTNMVIQAAENKK